MQKFSVALIALAVSACAALADDALHLNVPTLDRPTLTSLGVQVPITGDDDFNASVSVRYRRAGTANWRAALPLFRVHPENSVLWPSRPQFAGTIFDLRPGIAYEIELHAVDPDAAVDQTFLLNASTRPVPGDPVSPRNIAVQDVASLTAALNAAQPGDVITLADGVYNVGSLFFFGSGTAANPVVIRGASEEGTILDGGNCGSCNVVEIYGNWVHLERMTLRNAQRAVRFQTSGAQGNALRRVHIRNVQMALGARDNQLDFYICDNTVEGRLTWPSTYRDDKGAHASDDGLAVAGFGHVVCHNRISGFGDAMKTLQDGARGLDFYNNDILYSYDNGIELDGSEGNTRVFRNRFTNTYGTLSVQPVHGGPAYLLRNVVVNVADEQMKFHALGTNPPQEPNGVLAYHNTFVSPDYALNLNTPNASHHFAVVNNLFVTIPSPSRVVNWTGPMDDGLFDYNGYWPDGMFVFNLARAASLNDYRFWPNFAAMQAGGLEQHGTALTTPIFASGLTAPPNYFSLLAPPDASLAPGSNAIDRGLLLPNINDAYTGAGPDLGALEAGCPLPVYGPRPEGMDETNEPFGCEASAAQAPAMIAATAGTPQTATVGAAFAQKLAVMVKDSANAAIPNVSVTFQAPNSGQSGAFGAPCGGSTCVVSTNASGVATAPTFTANGSPGAFNATAVVGGLSATFSLTNIANTAPTADSVSPTSGSGSAQTFTFKYSSGNGWSYLTSVYGLINSGIGAGGCFFQYYAPGSTLYLYNDAGSAVSGTLIPGSATIVNNGKCTIGGLGFTATGSGNQLTLAVPISFSNTFTGAKSVYGYASDKGNSYSGWQTLGAWANNAIPVSPPTADSVSPKSGSGTVQAFTFKYSSANGSSYLTNVSGLVNGSVNVAGGCYFQYSAAGGALSLFNDAGTAVAGTLTPGSASAVSNGQCTIGGAGFTGSGSGAQLTLTIPITFSRTFAGAKNVYGSASDQANLSSGWQPLGTWTTNAAVLTNRPTADSVSPNSGAGSAQTFTFKYSSANGSSYLTNVYGLINSGIGAGGCFFQYYAPGNTLYLYNDAGSAIAGILTPGAATSASNGQCAIGASGFTASGSGNQLTIAVPIAFSSTFTGAKNVYGYATDQANLDSGWQALGTWTNSTVAANPPTADSVSPGSGSGASQAFVFKYSSGSGFSYLSGVSGMINSGVNVAAGCYFQYATQGGALSLSNDAGTAVAGTLTPGAGTSVHNGQCTIGGAGFTASGSGNQLTIVVPITFSNTFTGAKNVYGYASDRGNLNSGWQPVGTWTTSTAIVTNRPTADSVSPRSGSGTSQTFTFKYSSANGSSYLTGVFGLINSGISGAGGCFFQYYAPGNTLYLYDNAGAGVVGSLTPGAAASVNNGQCTVGGAGFTASGSGNQLTIAVPITFSSTFTGAKNVYGYASDQGNLDSGWQALGTWTR